MARPRSSDRRDAILSAATRVIAAQGLGAPTAAIAKEAGVSNGSLFLYFDTKAALLDELYVTLKTEMGTTALAGLPAQAAPRDQVHHMWTQWVRWATSAPDKHRALARLQVSGEITEQSHRAVSAAFGGIADLLERSRADGTMPLDFLLVLMNAIADAAIDTMIREPAQAEAYNRLAFEAVWRVIAGS